VPLRLLTAEITARFGVLDRGGVADCAPLARIPIVGPTSVRPLCYGWHGTCGRGEPTSTPIGS